MAVEANDAKEIFLAALDRESLPERAAYLSHACRGDSVLRQRVDALLRAHDEPGAFLSEAKPDPHATVACASVSNLVGTVIAGRYKLLEVVGGGGMGTVWMAEQREPVKRLVAVKLIKPGMDSAVVLARFEAERQALALMDHPNIAKVLDGGTTDDGRPYFVMELVKGLPLTEYCDARRLCVKDRLLLFMQICLAVQHAHQKAILHRDLKPSNVLVTEHDGQPVPKVIDFGLAKALNASNMLTERTLHTSFGTVVGTPLYMAPEQVGINALDVDTRTDIYSLGVILYELLAGSTPLEKAQFKQAAWEEVKRLIQEEEPPRPSTRLSSSVSLPSLAASRKAEPTQLSRLVRGDLDWIVMKALEKDRSRRYETANGLARDIQRYLADEVIEARPPSTAYRLGKFARKYRAALTTAVALVLLLVGGITTSTWLAVRATRAEAAARDAQQAEAERAEGERRANAGLAAANAELAAEQAKVQARFEMAMKAIALFHTGVSEDMLLKNPQFEELRTKLLKEAAGFYADLEKLLAGQTDAKSRKTLAEGYFQLGELTDKIGDKKETLRVHRKALALRRELAAAEGADVETRLDVARSLNRVGEFLRAMGDHAGSLEALEEQRDLAERLDAERPTDSARFVLAQSHNSIGDLRKVTGKPDEALTDYGKALAIRQKLADANPAVLAFQRDLAAGHNSIGALQRDAGKPEEALTEFRRALAIRQRLVDGNPAVLEFLRDLAESHFYIGWVLGYTGKPEDSLREIRKQLAASQKLADANPAVTDFQRGLAASYHSIGWLLSETRKHEEAPTEYRKGLAIRQKLADANPAVPQFQSALALSHLKIGQSLRETGEREEALTEFRKAVAIWQKVADANPAVTEWRWHLGLARQDLTWTLAAARPAKEALALLATELAANPEDSLLSLQVATLLAWLGQDKELAATLQRMRAFAKDTKEATAAERAAKACSILPSASKEEVEASLALARKGVELDKDGKWREEWTLLALGMAEYRSGHYAAAQEALVAAAKTGPNNPQVIGIAAFYQAMSLFQQGKEEEARKLALAAAATMKPLPKDEQNPLADQANHDDLILWLSYKEAKAMIRFDEKQVDPALTAELIAPLPIEISHLKSKETVE